MEYKFFEIITAPELDLNQIVKRGIMFKAASAKIANPKETKKNIARSLNVSERSLQRYAADLNFVTFKKSKSTTCFEPSKCKYCVFVAKNKSGLSAHTRSMHLKELANQTKLSDPAKPKKVKKEKLGLGETTDEIEALLKTKSNH